MAGKQIPSTSGFAQAKKKLVGQNPPPARLFAQDSTGKEELLSVH
jgi:hypothetical protein